MTDELLDTNIEHVLENVDIARAEFKQQVSHFELTIKKSFAERESSSLFY